MTGRSPLAALVVILTALVAVFAAAPAVVLARAAAPAAALARTADRASRAPRNASRALSAATLGSTLGNEMSVAGRHSSALVYDITAGSTLYSMRPGALRPPASVEKLYTATAALMRMGPSARLTTTVYGAGQLASGGIWEGNLYLRGGGDPTFGSGTFIGQHYRGEGASVATLVEQLVYHDRIHRVTGRVLGDETWFDSLRGEPSSGYAFDPWLEGDLSGLAFDRGQTGSFKGPHAPASYAAQQLLLGMKRSDASVLRGSGPAPAATPSDASRLASVQSPPLSTLLGLMLPPSDNYFAETLIKDLGARYGGAGSTAAGAAVVRQSIADLGLHPEIVDGSGLSREDLTSPEEVVDLLRQLAKSSDGAILRSDLAVAGRSGTLSERMRHTYAEGRCEGKTGTLEGVSNLVGYCNARDGHLLAFAFFDDGIETYRAHLIQDAMAEAVAGY